MQLPPLLCGTRTHGDPSLSECSKEVAVRSPFCVNSTRVDSHETAIDDVWLAFSVEGASIPIITLIICV